MFQHSHRFIELIQKVISRYGSYVSLKYQGFVCTPKLTPPKNGNFEALTMVFTCTSSCNDNQ